MRCEHTGVRHYLKTVVALSTLAALLLACGGDGSEESGAPTTEPDNDQAAGAESGASDSEGSEAGSSGESDPGEESDFAELVAAAEEEGEVEVWAYSDEERTTLQDAMNERFGTDITITGQELRASEAASRLITEADAGVATADFLQPSLDIAVSLMERDLIPEAFPWVEVFGDELPEIVDARDAVELDILQDRALNHRDVIYSISYRTDLITPEELPGSWEELADERFRGMFAVDARGYPFNYLAVDLGEEGTIDLVQGINDNDPIKIEGSSAVGAAVAGGDVPFAVGGMDVEAMLAGVPLEVHYLEPVPLNQLLALVPATAPHPNAARLFAAWHSVEGFRVLEEAELDYSSRATQTDLAYSASLYEQIADPEFVRISTVDEMELVARITDELGRIYTGT